ncbi:MAG: DUF4956 domain-containing protein [Eubacterium sp.]|nr:DUF4956 domain-containing protein [Eubacterium sp.]MCM1216281.1 DUF4956 domain-containing protein [Lachnospiraceae bacterium]MCM1303792.1 DUF4956 domain-containing protein [Butyrivibrio sp.]MCM1342834.1 DUF4956 domain-containing protein [Muribaculaceae bacterium]MCM1240048.1 DUF4956 domain-containing protein [Lachnospiraceae bacterium]
MLNDIFQGIFDSQLVEVIPVSDFLLCLAVALGIGLLLAGVYTYRNRYTKSFLVTLAMLPAVVCVVIMMVNGNVGTGVAVAGTFSLVRFRSVPGTAKEIGAIFLAMCTGLITGMGYLGFAVLFAVILSAVTVLYNRFDFGSQKKGALYKVLHIMIPEDLDYTGVFDEILEEYTSSHELEQVKTANMGSLFKLTYNITLKSAEAEKELIDKLRCRNGNLEISVSRRETVSCEL